MFNPYDKMKPKQKKKFEEALHFNNLYNARVSMFAYDGLPDTLKPEFIEGMFITQGTCGVGIINGGLYTGVGGYCGNIVNFVPEEYQFTNVGVGELRGKVGKDIVVGWNDATASPDWNLLQYASIFTEIDVSERLNVLFARLLRIPKVGDNKERKAIEDAILDLLEGRPTAVTSPNVLSNYIEGKEDNKFLDLADDNKIDKLQYLNQYRDNVLKRFFTLYGQGMQNTAKLAQQTTDELHGNDGVSMILPLQMLKKREDWVKEVNSVFGTNITVDFSEAWQVSEAEMEAVDEAKEVNPDSNDGSDNDSDNDDTNDDTKGEKEGDDNA
jgi:hypothetical protein